MTIITFYKKNDILTGFEVAGHTGKEDFGKDLLCCQISTVAQLAVVGVGQIKSLKPFVQIKDGYLKLKLNLNDASNEKVKFLMETCFQSFKSIIIGEEKFTKLEVKNDI